MTEAFAMGEYGAYVWSSFAIALIVLVICVAQGRARHKRVLNDVKTRICTLESES